MTLDAFFQPAEKSIRWAHKATAEVEREADSFFDFSRDDPFAIIVVEDDTNTGEKVQKLKVLRQIPDDLERKATEALNNARHSFDQTLNAGCSFLLGKRVKGANFPWATDPADLGRRIKNPAIDPRLHHVIWSQEPYGTGDTYAGGDDAIRTIATIANSKHTVGLSVGGSIQSATFPSIQFSGSSFKMPMPIWDSEKNEAELLRWDGDIKFGPQYNFTFYIRLNDPRFSQPTDILFALQTFTAKAEMFAKAIKAECAAIGC